MRPPHGPRNNCRALLPLPYRLLPQGGGGLLLGSGARGAAFGQLPAAPAGSGGNSWPSAGREQVVNACLISMLVPQLGLWCSVTIATARLEGTPWFCYNINPCTVSNEDWNLHTSSSMRLSCAGVTSAEVSWRSSSSMMPPASTRTCLWVGWNLGAPAALCLSFASCQSTGHAAVHTVAVLLSAARSCKKDIKRRCKGVKDGHGEVTACLRCSHMRFICSSD